MISEHVLLCSQTENEAESVGSWYGAEKVVVTHERCLHLFGECVALAQLGAPYTYRLRIPPFLA